MNRERKTEVILFIVACIGTILLFSGCGGPKEKDLLAMRKLSWEGTELTVTLGTNKSTGCEWKASLEDDSIIDASANRTFHLVSGKEGQAVGYSDIGFEGKRGGTATIMLTTPCGWDGTGDGYAYIVTVAVNEDGTIQSAEGKTCSAKELPQASRESYAGLYSCIGLYRDGQYLADEKFSSWSITLDADGGGVLDWGEDNRGPISEWSVQDGKLVIRAGVSVINGTIADDVMLLDLDDGLTLAWAGPDVDPEATDIDSSLGSGTDTPKPETSATKSMAGVYYPFAVSDGEYCISMQENADDGDGIIELNEDGTGSMMTGTVENTFRWRVDGSIIVCTDETGTIPMFTGTIENGILILDLPSTGEEGTPEICRGYFAAEGADRSSIPNITPEEYKALKKAN